MKKIGRVLLILCVGVVVFLTVFQEGKILETIGIPVDLSIFKKEVPKTYAFLDQNSNGTDDRIDIVNAARKDVEKRTPYHSGYYAGGYPPDTEGVCTDIIWRGLKGIDFDLKASLDADIAKHVDQYPRSNGKPDPNIDFRRVPNQNVYFSRNHVTLSTELNRDDVASLAEWQPGDIVVWL
ncbi:MAG: DUF1287 domain-containing protein, partial [Bacilli bacterium]